MKISIVTVCFNAADTLEQTIQSVLDQSHRDIEYIIVDGGSTDATLTILKAYDHCIDQHVSEPDDGLYDAMNKGLEMASGEAIGFLNADDCLASADAVQRVVECFKRFDADAVLGDIVLVDEKDMARTSRFYPARGFKQWQFRVGHAPPHPGSYIKTNVMRRLGGFNTDYPMCADFDLLLRLFQHTKKINFVAHLVVKMREGGLSTRGIKTTLKMNEEKRKSCLANGVATSSALMWLKYGFKIFQYFRHPTSL